MLDLKDITSLRQSVSFTKDDLDALINTPTQMKNLPLKPSRDFPLNSKDPLFDEGYVDVRDLGIAGHNFYYTCDEKTQPYKTKIKGAIPHLWVRKTVGHKLLIADAMLEKVGLGLYVLDGWRPAGVQRALYRWIENDLLEKHPNLDEGEIQAMAQEFVSLPPRPWAFSKTRRCPPHMTGGAVDIILIDRETKQPLNMGVYFDEFSKKSAPDYFENKVLNTNEQEALKNIRLRHHLMAGLGFAPIDSESWHFELYTRYWAKYTGAEAGFYGAMEPKT